MAECLQGFGGNKLRLCLIFSIALLSGCAVAVAAAEPLHFDVQFNDTILAQSDTALSLGDRFILNDVLLSGGETVGSSSGVCTVTDTQGVLLCTVTFVFADGTLSTQFVNTPPPEKHFAVLGGTGSYAGATGTGVVIENGDQTGSLEFTLAQPPVP